MNDAERDELEELWTEKWYGMATGFLTRHQSHVRRAALQSIHPARVGESQRADQRIA